jgi:UDP-glucose 4-epimerase
MRIAILGASGFIGKNLARRLILEKHQVVSFVRDGDAQKGLGLGEVIEFDFLHLAKVANLLQGFDSVVHLVSSTNPATSALRPRSDVTENLLGFLDLMEILKESKQTRLIFVSSGGAVYGVPNTLPIGESHPTNPVSAYGTVKLAIEKFLHVYGLEFGLDYRILRISNPYGPHQVNAAGQGLVPTIIERAIKKEPLTVWGDGSNIRDYLFVEDAVGAIVKSLADNSEHKILNIGSGVGKSILDLVSEVEDLLGESIDIRFEAKRFSDAPANVLDVSLAKMVLNWAPQTSLTEGLSRTIEWNRSRLQI